MIACMKLIHVLKLILLTLTRTTRTITRGIEYTTSSRDRNEPIAILDYLAYL